MKLDQFPHIILVNNKDIKFKEFDDKLNLNLKSFEKSVKTWQTKKDPVILEELQARSEFLAQHIYNYYVIEEEPEPIEDPVPDPTPDDIPPVDPPADVPPPAPEKPLSKNEQALKNLFDKELTTVTVAMLSAEGFNTGFNTPLGMKGCRIGSYELIRSGTHQYKLIKHD